MSLIPAAPASSAGLRHRWGEGVGEHRHARARASSLTAGTSRAASRPAVTGGPLRAATAPTSSRSKPAPTSASPSATACSGVSLRAPSKNESSVTLTIPAASGGGNSSVRSRRRHWAWVDGYRCARLMALRCVYTDLDGTLLGSTGRSFATRTVSSRCGRLGRSRPATGRTWRW